jgi:hypothetical protein
VLDAGQRDLGVRVVGRADVDGVDVRAFHEFAPVGFVGRVAPFFGEGLDLGLIAAADRLADRDVFGVEEVGELGVGVRVGAAHEAVADESDADFFFHSGGFWKVDKIARCCSGSPHFSIRRINSKKNLPTPRHGSYFSATPGVRECAFCGKSKVNTSGSVPVFSISTPPRFSAAWVMNPISG